MKIKVYSTEWCPWCTKVKDWLKENKVEFEDLNVGENQEAAAEMIEKTGQRGVPVTIYTDSDGEEHSIIGYNVPELEKLKGGSGESETKKDELEEVEDDEKEEKSDEVEETDEKDEDEGTEE